VNLDLTSIFARAQSLAEQAMTTSGTTVKGQRGKDLVTVDPDTLEETVVLAPVTVADTVALLVPQSGGANWQTYPGTPRSDTNWRLILPVAVTDVLVGDVFTVLTCRDPRLSVARQFVIKAIPDSSAGAIRDLTVAAYPETGQV
jgi:Family of unknown function (DUF6093)